MRFPTAAAPCTRCVCTLCVCVHAVAARASTSMYGVGEMCQGFCRASAVSGSVFMLDHQPLSLTYEPTPEAVTASAAAEAAAPAGAGEGAGDAGGEPGSAAPAPAPTQPLHTVVVNTAAGFVLRGKCIVAAPEYFPERCGRRCPHPTRVCAPARAECGV
jgi:hypothetical protein